MPSRGAPTHLDAHLQAVPPRQIRPQQPVHLPDVVPPEAAPLEKVRAEPRDRAAPAALELPVRDRVEPHTPPLQDHDVQRGARDRASLGSVALAAVQALLEARELHRARGAVVDLPQAIQDSEPEGQVVRPRLSAPFEKAIVRVGMRQRDKAVVGQVQIVDRQHRDGERMRRGPERLGEQGR